MRNIVGVFVAIICLYACGGAVDQKNGEQPDPQKLTRGEELFRANCAQCHQPAKNFVGPAIAGVRERWPDNALLYDFVRNSADVIQHDKYAKALYEKWNEAPMLPFPQLTDADIEAILDYCEQEAKANQ